MTDVTELTKEEFDKQVKNHLDDNFYWESVEEEVNNRAENDLEIYPDIDDRKVGVIDILVPDRAGQYLVKEALEMFGFKVDEDRYHEQLEEHIYWSNRLVDVASEYLNENLNINNDDVYIMFIFEGDFRLQFERRE
jgi:hypothetical protein